MEDGDIPPARSSTGLSLLLNISSVTIHLIGYVLSPTIWKTVTVQTRCVWPPWRRVEWYTPFLGWGIDNDNLKRFGDRMIWFVTGRESVWVSEWAQWRWKDGAEIKNVNTEGHERRLELWTVTLFRIAAPHPPAECDMWYGSMPLLVPGVWKIRDNLWGNKTRIDQNTGEIDKKHTHTRAWNFSVGLPQRWPARVSQTRHSLWPLSLINLISNVIYVPMHFNIRINR